MKAPAGMSTPATVVGLLPMAFKLETGSEAYAPLARAIIGGLISSILLTIFVVPAAYQPAISFALLAVALVVLPGGIASLWARKRRLA